MVKVRDPGKMGVKKDTRILVVSRVSEIDDRGRNKIEKLNQILVEEAFLIHHVQMGTLKRGTSKNMVKLN